VVVTTAQHPEGLGCTVVGGCVSVALFFAHPQVATRRQHSEDGLLTFDGDGQDRSIFSASGDQ